jgi:hypothetical protein
VMRRGKGVPGRHSGRRPTGLLAWRQRPRGGSTRNESCERCPNQQPEHHAAQHREHDAAGRRQCVVLRGVAVADCIPGQIHILRVQDTLPYWAADCGVISMGFFAMTRSSFSSVLRSGFQSSSSILRSVDSVTPASVANLLTVQPFAIDVHVTRQYVIANSSRRSHLTRMDERIKQQRDRLRLFFKRQLPMSRNAVCKAVSKATGSTMSESTLGAFIRGGLNSPRFPTDDTYNKLSTWSKWTIAELKGDAPVPSPEDIVSRKSDPSAPKLSDLETTFHQDNPNGARNGDDHQEGDMVYQLRLDLVERIWEIPAERLESLKKHIEAIEGAMAQLPRPHQRGKTAL